MIIETDIEVYELDSPKIFAEVASQFIEIVNLLEVTLPFKPYATSIISFWNNPLFWLTIKALFEKYTGSAEV